MALGKLFDLVGGKITPKEDCYIIQPLKVIMDEFPKDYLKIYAYLHFMKSMKPSDNPYADVPEDEREEQILRDIELDIDVEDPIIKRALECVEEKYYTTFYGMYTGIKASMDRFGRKLRDTEIDFNDKTGNARSIMAFAKDYEQLRKSYKTAYKDFDEEQGTLKVRGGGRESYDEDDD